MDNLDNPITEDAGTTTVETVGNAGETVETATQPSSTDADKKAMNDLKTKYENDIRNLQSRLDSNFAKAQRQWQEENNHLREKLEDIELRGLDEEDRAKVMAQRKDSASSQLQRRNQELESQLQDEANKRAYLQYFRDEIGIDPTKLVLDKDAAALVESGWAMVKELVNDYRKLKSKVTDIDAQKAKKKDEAPDVLVGAKGSPGKGFTWEAAIKRFGSREAVYQAYEEQVISQLPES